VRKANTAFLNQKETSMNSKPVISAIMAMCLTTGGFALAQNNGDRNDRGRNEQAHRGNQQDRRDNEGRQSDRRENPGHANNDQQREDRGAGPNHAFQRGERLPVEYRHRQYVVDDWRGHRLSAPPRGYHWVQTGSDYVLVAIATGIITQLLLSR
jgi:Ni/Co efflux regulator RcnB